MSEPTHVGYEVTAVMVEVVLEKIGVPPRPELIRERLLEIDRLTAKDCEGTILEAENDPGLQLMAVVVGRIGKLILDHSTDRHEITNVPSWALQSVLDVVQNLPNLSKTLDEVVTGSTSQKLNSFLLGFQRRVHVGT